VHVAVPIRLADLADPRLAGYHDLADADRLIARGLFVAEGRLVVRRAIESYGAAVQSLLLNESARRSLEPWLASLPDAVPVFLCETADFAQITGFNIHRGCLALVERPSTPSIGDLLARADADHGSGPITLVVLEGVANADNVGGVFRNAAAFGADAVMLDAACCDPLYRKAIRTSMAATLRVPFARVADRAGEWPAALSDVRARGFTLVALTPGDPARDLDDFARLPRPARLALLLGTEGPGLSAAASAAADYRVRIPVNPDVDSLNLSVAAGIALYRLSSELNPGRNHSG